MNVKEAQHILRQINRDPNILDQFTEEEIKELEQIASKA